MDAKILELAAEITKQAIATETHALGLGDEVVEFLDRTARKLAELQADGACDGELILEDLPKSLRDTARIHPRF
jgi:hypothetical protein